MPEGTPATDVGIDLVARRRDDGRWVAIQAKARQLDDRGTGAPINSPEMNKFLGAASDRGIWAKRWVAVNGDVRLAGYSPGKVANDDDATLDRGMEAVDVIKGCPVTTDSTEIAEWRRKRSTAALLVLEADQKAAEEAPKEHVPVRGHTAPDPSRRQHPQAIKMTRGHSPTRQSEQPAPTLQNLYADAGTKRYAKRSAGTSERSPNSGNCWHTSRAYEAWPMDSGRRDSLLSEEVARCSAAAGASPRDHEKTSSIKPRGYIG